MSILKVDTINEKTSGNGVYIPGHVIQTVYGNVSSQVSTSSTGAIETGLAVSITPQHTTSKILVTVAQNIQTSGSSYCQICLRRGTIASNTLLSIMVSPEGYTNSADEEVNQIPFSWLDSPATTSATRYFVSMEKLSGTTIYAQTSTSGSSVSTMVLQEIAQ